MAFVGGKGVECGGDNVLGLCLQDNVALCAEVFWQMGCGVNGDECQSALVGPFSLLYCLRPIVPRACPEGGVLVGVA